MNERLAKALIVIWFEPRNLVEQIQMIGYNYSTLWVVSTRQVRLKYL